MQQRGHHPVPPWPATSVILELHTGNCTRIPSNAATSIGAAAHHNSPAQPLLLLEVLISKQGERRTNQTVPKNGSLCVCQELPKLLNPQH